MRGGVVAEHQLAGLHDRRRRFSRLVEVERVDGAYRVAFHYEPLAAVTERWTIKETALPDLVKALHARRFTQLRSRLSFCGGLYLGSQGLWVEYPDLPHAATGARKLTRLAGAFRRRWSGSCVRDSEDCHG